MDEEQSVRVMNINDALPFDDDEDENYHDKL